MTINIKEVVTGDILTTAVVRGKLVLLVPGVVVTEKYKQLLLQHGVEEVDVVTNRNKEVIIDD